MSNDNDKQIYQSLGPQVFKVLIALFSFFVCLFFCLLVLLLLLFPVHSPSKSLFPRSNLMSGKIKCVTQNKQACELSARNYGFEILQRIHERCIIGENCFQFQIRQNHFISEGS